MEWHYTQNDEAVGPVSEEEIKDLLAQGTITPASMVWNSTFEEWKPLSETDLASVASAPATDVALDLNTEPCSVCGKTFSNDELVDINGNKSCAECKPVALRQFQENTAVSTDLHYAGFWARVGTTILDGIILMPVNLLMVYLLGAAMVATPQNAFSNQLLIQFLQIAVSFLYTTLLIWKYGGTLGLLSSGLRVVNADGTPVSYLKSVARYFAYMLSGLTFGIGFIMVAFDKEKRALHDMICGTRVIYKNK